MTDSQVNNLTARMEDLQITLDERWRLFEWVLETLGESHWADGLLEQCARLEREIGALESRLARQ